MAALFTSDGQIVDKEGNVAEGREAIAKTFAELFAANAEETPGGIRRVDSVHRGGPGGGSRDDEGNARAGRAPENDRYTVLHVKRDGKWQMALARDEEGPPATAHEQLRPLAWLVGEWVDDGGSVVVVSSCRWSADRHFLLQDFKLKLNGRDAMNVTQRIGWDPLAKQIHSWVFDSEGGFGESLWTRDGNGWIIKATGVRPDGTTASATNLLTPIGHRRLRVAIDGPRRRRRTAAGDGGEGRSQAAATQTITPRPGRRLEFLHRENQP